MIELKNFSLWTGDYSGCFIPDCFTPVIEEISQKISSVLWDKDFAKEVYKETEYFSTPNVSTFELRDMSPGLSVNVNLVDLSFYYYFSIVGQMLLSKRIGAKEIFSYATKREYAIALAITSYKLGVKCTIVLDKNLSEDKVIVDYLKHLGCEVDDVTCKELFDLPAMYAFQKWLTHPGSFFISEKANAGPYVFTQTNLKIHEYATSFLLQNFKKTFEEVDSVIFPIETGTIGVSLFLNLNKKYPLKFFSVRKTSSAKRNVGFCGGVTIAVAPQGHTKLSDIIAPYMASLWDSKHINDISFSTTDVENGLRMITSSLPVPVNLASGGALSKGIEVLKSTNSKSGVIFLWRL